jgi:Na+-driven multidrug efflux pump
MATGIAQIRRSVLTLALPVTVSSLLQRAEGIVAVFLVGGLGAVPIAAVGLGQLLAFIATTLVSGLSVGSNVVMAQLWGARRYDDAGQAARHFLGLSILISLGLLTFGLLVNGLAMELLGAQADVIQLALPYSNLIFLLIPFTILLQVLSCRAQVTPKRRCMP